MKLEDIRLIKLLRDYDMQQQKIHHNKIQEDKDIKIQEDKDKKKTTRRQKNTKIYKKNLLINETFS